MTKVFTLLFSVLSLGAVWLTYADVGLQTANVTHTTKSVRQGSSSTGSGFYGGGYRSGK